MHCLPMLYNVSSILAVLILLKLDLCVLCPLWWNNYNFYQVLDMSIDINIDKRTGNYFPTIYFNEFWLMKDKLVAINETVTELILNLELGPIGLTKWQIFLQIDQSFQIHRSYGSMVEGEADELKVRF